MPKKCKLCGTVNDSDARYCKRCRGTEFSSGKTANPSRTQAGGGAGKSVFCKKCNKPQRVTGGPYTEWLPAPPPIDQYEEEWKFYALVCRHKYYIGKTGRTKPWEP